MIKIEIIKDGATYTVERNLDDLSICFSDLINLLNCAGFTANDMEKALHQLASQTKKNHKNDSKTFQNFSTL
jgi:hypothetical protein